MENKDSMEINLSNKAIFKMLYLNADCIHDDTCLTGGVLGISKNGNWKDSMIGKECIAVVDLWNQVKDNKKFKKDVGDKNYSKLEEVISVAIKNIEAHK